MEMLLVIPLLMFMGGAAIYMALSERSMPIPQRHTFVPRSPTADTSTHPITSDRGAYDNATISQSDVLLADALTEMLELKEELSGLRTRVGELDTQVHHLTTKEAAPQNKSSTRSRRPSVRAS